MPSVAPASALSPMATRTLLTAMIAVHALCSTMKTMLVALTNHAGLFAEGSIKEDAELSGLFS